VVRGNEVAQSRWQRLSGEGCALIAKVLDVLIRERNLRYQGNKTDGAIFQPCRVLIDAEVGRVTTPGRHAYLLNNDLVISGGKLRLSFKAKHSNALLLYRTVAYISTTRKPSMKDCC